VSTVLVSQLPARARWLSRWVLIVPVGFLLWTIGMASASASSGPAWLGVSAAVHDGVARVDWVEPGGYAWDAGIRPGDQLLRVDGGMVNGASHLEALNPVALNDAHTVVARSERTHQVLMAPPASDSAPTTFLQQLSYFLIAASFAVLGAVVFIIATDLLAASVMLVFSVSAAAMLLATVGTVRAAPLTLAVIFISLLAFTTSALWLFLVFPTNRLRRRWVRLLAYLSVAAALLVCIGYAACLLVNPMLYELVRPVYMLLVVADLLAAIGALVASLITAFRTSTRDADERQNVRRALGTLTLGAIAGFGPFGGLAILPTALGAQPIIPPHLAVLGVLLLPVSLAAALLSHQFLGIERVVRRGLIALVIWIALLAPYAWMMPKLRTVGGVFSSDLGSAISMLGLAFTVGTFPTLQRLARRWIEQRVFGDVYDFAETVQAFGSELAECSSAQSIVDHALARLGRTLDLRWAALQTVSPDLAFAWRVRPDVDLALDSPALVVPLVSDSKTIGRLVAGSKDRDVQLSVQDEALVVAVAPLIGSALQSALLLQQLEQQVDLLYEREETLVALSGRLMRVQEEERRRLALELHDDPLQRASLLARRLAGRGLVSEQEAAEDVAIALRAICYGLRPPMLDDLGLGAALDRLVGDVAARSDVQVNLLLEGFAMGDRLDADLEVALYRVTQEALNNVLKHAEAEHALVKVFGTDDAIELHVEDDGRGTAGDYSNERSLGVVGMRERLMPWDGQVTISARPHGGTRVVARVRRVTVPSLRAA
jgi:signal transduction histidine kinase